MHVGRQLPHRLIAIAITIAAFSACISERYLGSVGDGRRYSNRGFGIVLDLGHGDLSQRWLLTDPRALQDFPADARPQLVDAPLDLDGNGLLAIDETTRHLRPTARLVTLTGTVASSTITARVDIDVVILGGDEKKLSLEDVTRASVHQMLGKSAVITELGSRRASPDFEAKVADGRYEGGAFRIAVIDQKDFYSPEIQLSRRQAVRVLMTAPAIDEAFRSEHELILEALVLNQRGAPTTTQEEW
jgi:hypothetical protein